MSELLDMGDVTFLVERRVDEVRPLVLCVVGHTLDGCHDNKKTDGDRDDQHENALRTVVQVLLTILFVKKFILLGMINMRTLFAP